MATVTEMRKEYGRAQLRAFHQAAALFAANQLVDAPVPAAAVGETVARVVTLADQLGQYTSLVSRDSLADADVVTQAGVIARGLAHRLAIAGLEAVDPQVNAYINTPDAPRQRLARELVAQAHLEPRGVRDAGNDWVAEAERALVGRFPGENVHIVPENVRHFAGAAPSELASKDELRHGVHGLVLLGQQDRSPWLSRDLADVDRADGGHRKRITAVRNVHARLLLAAVSPDGTAAQLGEGANSALYHLLRDHEAAGVHVLMDEVWTAPEPDLLPEPVQVQRTGGARAWLREVTNRTGISVAKRHRSFGSQR